MRSFVFWFMVGGGFAGLSGSAEAQPNGAPTAAPATQPTASAPASQPAQRFQNLPKELILELRNGVKMEFVLIPAGAFIMGAPDSEQDRALTERTRSHFSPINDPDVIKDFSNCERPQHKVTFIQPFYMSKYLVTQSQWMAIPGFKHSAGRCPPGKSILEYHDLPVCFITWNDCQNFCKGLSEYSKRKARLPSESEWEYACRAGTTTRFYYGDDPDFSQLGDYAWFIKNDCGLVSVGAKKPNPWGLYDMHGYQFEWCEDEWHDNYIDAPTDGKAWVTGDGQYRVLRGGSGVSTGDKCRSAYRLKGKMQVPATNSWTGFRVVVEVPENP